MCYSTEPRDGIFVRSYELLSFSKNMIKNKNLSGKCSQKLLHHAKISAPATDAPKTTSKK